MKTNSLKIDDNKNITENEEADYVPQGCVCIKYDKISKQPVWIYGKDTVINTVEIAEAEEDPYFVFQRLASLHQNRKYDYIRKWGIDEYDKMFMFQNYDYEYFDKLDDDIKNVMENYYQNNTYNYNKYYNSSEYSECSDNDIGSDIDN
jgi:hypothetical protein